MANKMLPSGISVRIREDLIDGVSRVQTTLTIDPIVTLDGHRVTMADIGSIGYAKIDGGTAREEIVSWTGITDNTTTYTLTGCVWGVNFYNLENAVGNYKRHTAGAKFEIKTDMHYLTNQFRDNEDNVFTNTDSMEFNTSEIRLGDGTNAADKYITADNGDASEPYMKYDESLNKWLISNNGVDSYDPEQGGSGLVAGHGIDINSGAIDVDLTELTTDTALDTTGGQLSVVVDETTGLSVGATGIAIDIINNSSPDFDEGDKVIRLDENGVIPRRFLNENFGDGSDGNAVISSNTSLSADKQYNNLTINAGVTLNASGYKIFVKGTLLNNGTIANNGGNGGAGGAGQVNNGGGSGGSAGSGGAGNTLAAGLNGKIGGAGGNSSLNGNAGSAGDAKNPSATGVNGVAGVAGGNGLSGMIGGSAGGAGAATSENIQFNQVDVTNTVTLNTEVEKNFSRKAVGASSGASLSSSAGSGSSGGGAGSQSANATISGKGGGGGGSGGNGGIVYISAKTITNNGSIESKGGNGGNGGAGFTGSTFVDTTSSAGGGGGSGGQGGLVILIYEIMTGNNPVVSGGSAGTGGTGGYTGYGGANGNAGNAGKYAKIKLTNSY